MLSKKFLGKDTLFVFIVVLVLLLPSFAVTCNIYSNLNFDSQSFLTWLYAAEKNYMPYKDVFYPYGFFLFYKQTSPILGFIDLLLKTFLFVFYYRIFRLIFVKKLYSIIYFFFFVAFILQIAGVDIFLRYGLIIAFSVASFLTFHATSMKSRNANLLLGLFCGGIFSLMPDQGIYAFLIYLFILILTLLKGTTKNIHKSIKSSISIAAWFITGSSIFLVPFLAYLLYNGALAPFLNSFSEYKNIALLAKIPFPPSLFSIDNIFTISLLILTISVLSKKILVNSEKFSRKEYLGIGIIVALFLLEQKNVARSIDAQLSFIGFLLFCYLFSFLTNNAKKAGLVTFSFISFIIIFGIGLKENNVFIESKNLLNLDKSSSCLSQNLNYNDRAGSHFKVLNKISSYNGPMSIFGYPQDPIFYIIFDQKTPYYFSVYEASYLAGQKRILEYFKEYNPEYVIVNTKTSAIQDSVPDIVRGNIELAYILRNYIFKEKVDDFLILKRSLESDYFSSPGWNTSAWGEKLLDVDFGGIPYLEARDKRNELKKPIAHFDNIQQLNSFLMYSKISSVNKFILFKANSKERIQLTVKSDSGIPSKVSLTNCAHSCLVHLDRLPLFFSPKLVHSIESEENNQITDIQLFEDASSLYW